MKNKSTFKIYSISILLLFTFFLSIIETNAQEILTAPSQNPALKNGYTTKVKKSNKKGSSKEVHLPFIDDFSKPILYPNQNKWNSKSVFVNQSYAINPPTIGVATFDAMNDTGKVYSHMTSFPSGADTLLSHNIRLDSIFKPTKKAITPADSVYLSFFVQPEGYGAAPLDGDSLVLQFFNPQNNSWKNVWQINGMSLDSFRHYYDTSFIQVMIPIVNPDYFAPNFKFRFYNYARIPSADKPSWRSGLHCHWNIDYVILDIKRSSSNNIYNDLAIQNIQNSLLVDYTHMPWNQFKADESNLMQYDLGIKFKNFNNKDISVNQYFYIYDNWDKSISYINNPSPASMNVSGYSISNFTPSYGNSPKYIFNTNSPLKPEFKVLYSVKTDGFNDIIEDNDSMFFFQKFYNYFAYDDKVPEAGYGLSTNGGKVAYRFKINTPDSLQSIQMYFNQTLGDANQKYFVLTIWDDNNGNPGNILYEQSGERPEFENDLFKYHTYILKEAQYVSGTIYIGWRQTTKDNLNIGFDINNDQSKNIFYNVTGDWHNSSFKGCLMIRPILGDSDIPHVDIKEKTIITNNISLEIYPNPNNGSIVNIETKDYSKLRNSNISICNIQGQIVHIQKFSRQINIEQLSSGIYFIKVFEANGNINITKKLIINR